MCFNHQNSYKVLSLILIAIVARGKNKILALILIASAKNKVFAVMVIAILSLNFLDMDMNF